MNVSYYRLTARESEPAATGWALHFFFFFSRRWWGGGFHAMHKKLYRHLRITFLSQTPSSFFSPLAANKEYTRDRLLGNRGKVQNYRFLSSFSFFYNGDLMHFLIRQGGGNRTLEGPQSISSRNPRSPRQSIRQTRFSQSITS